MKKLLLLFCVFTILFIYNYPHIIAISNTPKGFVYLGQNSFFDPWDINLYVSVINYGQLFGLRLENFYTSSPNTPVLIYVPLTILGSVFQKIDPFLLFHLAAFFAGFALLVGMFLLIRNLGFTFYKSLFCMILIALGGGLGFLGDKIQSADTLTSAFTFYSTFQKPHEALAVLCLLGAFVFTFSYLNTKKQKYVLFISLFLTSSVFIYPYLLIGYLIPICIYLAIEKQKIKTVLLLLLSMILPLITTLIMLNQFFINKTFGGVGQNLGLSVSSLVFGFGIILQLAILSIFKSRRTKLLEFLAIWLFTTLFLSLLPFGPGKIFLRGIFFPAVLLSFISIENILKLKPKLPKEGVWIAYSLLVLGTSFYIFSSRISNSYTKNQWVYMSVEENEILKILNNKTPKGSSVLTYYKLSNLIPARTSNRVYVGHMLQTPDYNTKIEEAAEFFAGEGSVAQKKQFLSSNKINYVIWGLEEDYLFTKNSNPKNEVKELLKGLKKVHSTQNLSLYALQ